MSKMPTSPLGLLPNMPGLRHSKGRADGNQFEGLEGMK